MRDLRVPIWMCQTQAKMRERKERRKQTGTGDRRLGHKVKSFMTVIDESVDGSQQNRMGRYRILWGDEVRL